MNRYKIINADVKTDIDNILSVLKRNLPGPNKKKHFWKYENCPYGLARCYLVYDEKTKLFVGSGGRFPREVNLDGKIVLAEMAADFAVDKEHRILGPALILQKQLQEEGKNFGTVVTYCTTNEEAKPIIKKVGFRKVGNIQSYVRILNPRYIKKIFTQSYFFRITCFLLGYINKIISKENRVSKKSENNIEIINEFDKRFDDLNEKTKYQFKIIGDRSSKFLNWRFTQAPDINYQIFSMVDKSNKLLGYIVYYIENYVCQIYDISFLKINDVVRSLIAEFIIAMKNEEVANIAVQYFGDSYIKKIFKEFHFYKSKRVDGLYLIGSQKISDDLIFTEDNWYFLRCDEYRR
jgi:hypothetical protein